MSKSFSRVGLLTGLIAFPGLAHSEVSFPRDTCAVVVASRPSIAETRSWIDENWRGPEPAIYLSQNGWYAIAATTVPIARSASHLNTAKAEGRYPGDAYCSTGEAYLRRVWLSPAEVSQAPVTGLFADFDARPLSIGDKAFLQSALALEGYYNGMIDGSWGSRSQSAMESFIRDTFDRDPTNADSAFVAMRTLARIRDEGWERSELGRVGYSLILPMAGLKLEEEDGLYSSWVHSSKDLVLIFGDMPDEAMADIHSDVIRDHSHRTPYTVRDRGFWVTSVTDDAGATIYVRSDLWLGTWSTVFVAAGSPHAGDVALITGSIVIDDAGLFSMNSNGVLMRRLNEFSDWMGDGEEETGVSARSPTRPAPADPGSEEPAPSTGTGFYINDDGVLLTNAHVVEDCDLVTVEAEPAQVLSVSSAFDLAAIQVTGERGAPLAFAAQDVGLNADITLAGYPLHGLLGGLNVSRGSVSSMKGLGGNETTLQISAPVQPGNSGGPVVDQFGQITAVVVAKLDAMELASVTGDIAQNVNFAIRGSLAKIFLSSNEIDYRTADESTPLAPEDIASRLQAATRLINCD